MCNAEWVIQQLPARCCVKTDELSLRRSFGLGISGPAQRGLHDVTLCKHQEQRSTSKTRARQVEENTLNNSHNALTGAGKSPHSARVRQTRKLGVGVAICP